MKLAVFLVLTLCYVKTQCVNVTFQPPKLKELYVDQSVNVTVHLSGFNENIEEVYDSDFTTLAEPKSVLSAKFINETLQCYDDSNSNCNGTICVKGRFLGFGKVNLFWKVRDSSAWTKLNPPLNVTVLRHITVLNKVFTAFVATVVSINYINMGCALDLGVVKGVLRRPIGPVVCFFCQFVVMPLVAYGAGKLLLQDPVLRLGLFTFGSSPGGGASNMWTVLLGGNLNLSITMTFISTLAALGTIPLWLFTLGRTILEGTTIVIPFENIVVSLVSLTVPVGVGLLIQRFIPKLASRSKRLLAPICIIIIICIIVLAAVANYYIFFLLTWRLVIAAMISVWSGFAAGALISLVFRFPVEDIIAVAVETGIQNSGISFLLLSYSLKPPVSDMAAVVPVAGSIITPLPLLLVYCWQKMRNCCCKRNKFDLDKKEDENYGSIAKNVNNPEPVNDVHY